MAEVVYNSLQYLSDEDVAAMAVYLKSLPKRDAERRRRARRGSSVPSAGSGRKVYETQCAMCHGAEGKGHRRKYPPLAGNQSITMSSPVNSIRMVLNGGYPPARERIRAAWMPPFAHILNDAEVAAVVTYIRVAWNNSGTPVTPTQSSELRPLLPSEARVMPQDQTDDAAQRRVSTTSSAADPPARCAVAGIATAIVVIIYFAFYFVVYLPRGAVQ
jgi:mono/diheme cytochrome c family protein